MLVCVRCEDLEEGGMRGMALTEAGFTNRIQTALAALTARVPRPLKV